MSNSSRQHRSGWPRLRRAHALLWACVAFTAPAWAAAPGDATPGSADALREELAALRAQQARIAELQRSTDAGIRRLERLLGVEDPIAPATADAVPVAPGASQGATAAAAAAAQAPAATALAISGDLRLRHERNFSEGDGPGRNRGALRARIGAEYALSQDLAVGARLVTGNLDDPRSTGVTLSNFNDDFDVGLDRLYASYRLGNAMLWGGKFANPFRTSSLVWDGDVNPQGAAVDYERRVRDGARLHATALYFAVDEHTAGDDSHMLGGQLGLQTDTGTWGTEAYLAYYHYMLDGIGGADPTDFRTNLLSADGGYLSDFHLANVILGGTYGGFGEAWPLRLTGEYVRNLGAATDADSGYSLDTSLGRGSRPGDWRFRYGYQVAETDAVLAAFSHDDTTLATNYRQHTLALDYVLRPDTVFNFTWYRYRPDNAGDTPGFVAHDWLHRLRFNLLLRF